VTETSAYHVLALPITSSGSGVSDQKQVHARRKDKGQAEGTHVLGFVAAGGWLGQMGLRCLLKKLTMVL
jgi:hypothetical protein